MGRTPLPHTLPIFRPPEVVLVLRLTQPPPLTGRLRRLSTFHLRAIVLTFPITEVKQVDLAAIQTLELVSRFQSDPTKAVLTDLSTPLQKRKSKPQENKKEEPGRRAFIEALEEDKGQAFPNPAGF